METIKEQHNKQIGKYQVVFKKYTDKFHQVSVYFNHKKANWLIECGNYDNRQLAYKTYQDIKIVSDVHKYLNSLNPTDRPLRDNDKRMRY